MGDDDTNSIVRAAIELKNNGTSNEDIEKSIDLLLSVEAKSDWAKKELIKILGSIREEKYSEKYICLLNDLTKIEPVDATIRLGQAYREGYGVEKNIKKSIELLREYDTEWSQKELIKTVSLIEKEDFALYLETLNYLSEKGNIEATILLSKVYYEGIYVAKNVQYAVDLLNRVSNKSQWATEKIVNYSIESGMPELASITQGKLSLPYNYVPDIQIYTIKSGNSLIVCVSDDVWMSLYRNGEKIKSMGVKKGKSILKIESEGLYYVSAVSSGKNMTRPVYSEVYKFYNNPCERSAPAKLCPIPFYKSNYPYEDLGIIFVDHGKNVDDSLFNDMLFEKRVFGTYELYLVRSGNIDIKRDGTDLELFSGVGIIDDIFVYGQSQFVPRGINNKLNNNIGDFSHLVMSKKELFIETDRFGLSKLYVYKKGQMTIVSNRYHLLIIMMRAAGVSIVLNEQMFRSYFYMYSGLYAEHPISDSMVITDTRLLRSDSYLHFSDKGCKIIRRSNKKTSLSNSSYESQIKECAEELIHNLQLVVNNDIFDKIRMDITGGLDSRLAISVLSHVKTNKDIIVDTGGHKDIELKIASNIAKTMGYKYSSKQIAYRYICGGYSLNVDGSLSNDQYLDLALSADFGTFDSSLPSTICYDEKMIHLTGWFGEAIRPYITNRILKDKVNKDSTPESIANSFVRSKTPVAICDYLKTGIYFEKNLSSEFSRYWEEGIRYSMEQSFSNFNLRVHNDFYKDCSYSMNSWATLMSVKTYELFQKNIESEESAKIVYDLTNYLCGEIADYAYDIPISNIERTIVLRDILLKTPKLLIPEDMSDDYKQCLTDASNCELYINGKLANKEPLKTKQLYHRVAERCRLYLNYIADNSAIEDIVGDLSRYIDKMVSKQDWKQLSSVYKKLGTAAESLLIDKGTSIKVEFYQKLVIDK